LNGVPELATTMGEDGKICHGNMKFAEDQNRLATSKVVRP